MVKKIAIISLIVFAIFTSQVFATVSYYSNGSPSMITNDKGTIYYYENGYVKQIFTTEGSIWYNEDGTVSHASGDPSISYEEAKSQLQALEATPSSTTTTTTTTTNNTNLPNTGIEDSYILIIPCLVVIAGLLFYEIRKFK